MKKRFTYIGLGLAVLLLMAVPAFSQSCALCYTQAASAGSRMIQALKSGILVLIVPPTLGSIGMIFVVYKKRNQVRRTDHDELDDEHDHEHAGENFVRNDDESAQD
jgi:TRAP-type C4-dicarboxylate transport system permease small subunit